MIVDFDVEVSGVRELPPGSPANANGVLRNHLKHIMEKRGGAWKVLSAQNTFIAARSMELCSPVLIFWTAEVLLYVACSVPKKFRRGEDDGFEDFRGFPGWVCLCVG